MRPETTAEAARQLLGSGDKFHMFLNSETSQINVLYRKADDSLGLLEPEI